MYIFSTLSKKNNLGGMENKIIRVSLGSILIYLISSKLYSILSKIFLWIGIDYKISNQLIQTSLYIIVLTIVLLCFFSLYNSFLKSKVPSNQGILILFSTFVILSLLNLAGNYWLGKLGAKQQLDYTEFLSIYGSLDLLDTLFAGIYTILVPLIFLWKLYRNKKKLKEI